MSITPGDIVQISDEPGRWTVEQVTRDGVVLAHMGRPLIMRPEADLTVVAKLLDLFPIDLGDTVQHRYCQVECEVVAFEDDEVCVVYGAEQWPGRWPIKDMMLVRRAGE